MTYLIATVFLAVEMFNALPSVAAIIVAVAATGTLIAYGSRAVSDFCLARSVNR